MAVHNHHKCEQTVGRRALWRMDEKYRLMTLCRGRESVAIDTGLLLTLSLIAPLEVALCKTSVNTDGHVVWDLGKEKSQNLRGRVGQW